MSQLEQKKLTLRDVLKQHIEKEHDCVLGRFELDAIINLVEIHLSSSYYNAGLNDAVSALSKRLDLLIDDVLLLEKNDE